MKSAYADLERSAEMKREGKSFPKGYQPPALVNDIKKRTRNKWTCPDCGRVVAEIAKGPHRRWHYKLPEARLEVLLAVATSPGLNSRAYQAILGSKKVEQVKGSLQYLKAKNLVYSEGPHGSFVYFITPKAHGYLPKGFVPTPIPSREVQIRATVPSDSFSPEGGDKNVLDGFGTLPVIESVSGDLFTIREGKFFRVRLEEVTV